MKYQLLSWAWRHTGNWWGMVCIWRRQWAPSGSQPMRWAQWFRSWHQSIHIVPMWWHRVAGYQVQLMSNSCPFYAPERRRDGTLPLKALPRITTAGMAETIAGLDAQAVIMDANFRGVVESEADVNVMVERMRQGWKSHKGSLPWLSEVPEGLHVALSATERFLCMQYLNCPPKSWITEHGPADGCSACDKITKAGVSHDRVHCKAYKTRYKEYLEQQLQERKRQRLEDRHLNLLFDSCMVGIFLFVIPGMVYHGRHLA